MTKTTSNRTRFRPLVEPLEAVMLLSHVPAAPLLVHAEAQKTKGSVAPVDVQLSGTLHGTGTLSGLSTAASGSGYLGKVGTASFSIKANHPSSTLTLSTKKGNIVLANSGLPLKTSSGVVIKYSVIGGTKSYANAYGSGTITAIYSLLKGNKPGLTLTFS